ncbi:MAG: hypothetical protein EAZ85_13325 [Bacteroidetes bacterium]|nr:MAG: hypothetical protein EAZ85_13325 [Bacteroidota bacterium]TAG87778.1 MAG: hypothetical protein EAZ20_09945 [Bacteroidota bacterium]
MENKNIDVELKDNIKVFYAETKQKWREWLELNHKNEKSIWLIIYHKKSQTPSVYYDEAVDEALCFGWIDSKINKRNNESFFQFFSKRNPKSNWSKVNKQKVEKLIELELMTEEGYKMIEIAKKTGTWNALDDVENNIIPDDLQQLFDQNPTAYKHWQDFSRSSKRGILEWILNAKRPETRQKRIEETVTLAEKNLKANQYQQ